MAAGAWSVSTGAPPTAKVKISGTVRAGMGKQVRGVAVRATHLERGTSVTVFTSGNGNYRIDDLEPGHYEVRLTKRGFVTTARRLTPGGPMPQDFGLTERPRTLGNGDPTQVASQFPSEPDKPLVVDFCLRCHSVLDLAPLRKDPQGWEDIVVSMAPRRRRNVSAEETRRLAAYLSRHFGSARPAMAEAVEQPDPPTENGVSAVFREYAIPATSDQGDAAGGKAPAGLVVTPDRVVWFSLQDSNRIGRLDPELAAFRTWSAPSTTFGLGGLVQTPDRNFWFSEPRSNKAGRFDAATGKIDEFQVPSGAGSVAHDSRGNLYFAVGASGQIARRDVATGDVRLFDLPDRSGYPVSLAVDARDRVWVTQLFSDSIASIDPSSGAVKQHPTPTPNSAPRGLALDKDGKVWFTEWLGNRLGRLDPDSGGITEYELPAPSSEPYDVAVDKEQKVWVSGRLSNTLLRFDPSNGSFLEYPAPLPRAGLGRLAADPVAGIWFSAQRTGSIGLLVRLPDKRR